MALKDKPRRWLRMKEDCQHLCIVCEGEIKKGSEVVIMHYSDYDKLLNNLSDSFKEELKKFLLIVDQGTEPIGREYIKQKLTRILNDIPIGLHPSLLAQFHAWKRQQENQLDKEFKEFLKEKKYGV